jgi:hypothetical protein
MPAARLPALRHTQAVFNRRSSEFIGGENLIILRKSGGKRRELTKIWLRVSRGNRVAD